MTVPQRTEPDLTGAVTQVVGAVRPMLDRKQRILVGIAGAPGSGKSTLAVQVAARLEAEGVSAQVLPMDGYHLDNAILAQRGLLPRKGAPETFDATGFIHMVGRLRKGDTDVVIPAFDRSRDIAIAGAAVVPAGTRVIVAEGNYLLFDKSPWQDLADLWDLSVQIDVPVPVLRDRLIQRWLDHGLSAAAATARAEGNDIPNAVRIVENTLPADVVLSGQEGR